MILKQYFLGCLSHASYLIADRRARMAVVVDPRRDVDEYLEDAERLDVRIVRVILTHFHADFVSGHLELRERTGATLHLGARAGAEYGFEPLREGDVLEFGTTRLSILETPGHTPESISILVYDLERSSSRPHAVLTGDTVFVGDVGRPDLMAAAGFSSEELAGMLYDSIHKKLMTLPDETLIYPAHGAGSLCGKSLGEDTFSTIGAQRRGNHALKPMSREEFIRRVTGDLPEVPAYFSYDAALNRKIRPTLETTLARSLKALSIGDVLRLRGTAAHVIDARDPDEFAPGHLKDSFNIPLSSRYATYSGMVLPPEQPIVIVADPGREREAALRLGRIGFDSVAGFLEGGAAAVPAEHRVASGIVDPTELARRLESEDAPFVLDVRMAGEFGGERIEGAVNVPLHKLQGRIAEIPRDRAIVVCCEAGYRSSLGVSILQRNGFAGVSNLRGGLLAWTEAVRG